MNPLGEPSSPRILTLRKAAVLALSLAVGLAVVNRIIVVPKYIFPALQEVDVPASWPFRMIELHLPGVGGEGFSKLLGGVVLVAIFLVVLKPLARRRAAPVFCVPVALALVLASNAIQTVYYGFVFPIVSGGCNYINCCPPIESAAGFLREFNRLQPTYGTHVYNHPPGATLFFWEARRLVADPCLKASSSPRWPSCSRHVFSSRCSASTCLHSTWARRPWPFL